MKPGDILPLDGPVSFLIGENNGRFPRSHGMLIASRGRTALIDTGAGRAVLEPLAARVDLVLNSHSHADHAAGNWLFDGRRILAPRASFADSGDLWRLSLRYMKTDRQAAGWRQLASDEVGMRPQRPSGWFEPGQRLSVGRVEVIALDAPGHTADHTCFYLPEWGLVYSGDIDMSSFGPWYANPESSIAQTRRSIKMIMELRPRVLAPAHNLPLREGVQGRLRAYLAVVDRRREALLGLLRRPRSWSEIVGAALIYGQKAIGQSLFRYFESQMIGKHLDELLDQGLVRCVDGLFTAV